MSNFIFWLAMALAVVAGVAINLHVLTRNDRFQVLAYVAAFSFWVVGMMGLARGPGGGK